MLDFQDIKGESFRHVAVYVKEADTENYKWTSGLTTGRVREKSEAIEVKTDSPLVEPTRGFYHKEDIRDSEEVLND